MWVSLRTCIATLLALGSTAACGKTGTTESGETHFVTCNTQADCSGVSGAHDCVGGVCREAADGDDTSTTVTPACAGGCGVSECGTPGTCSLSAACSVVGCGSVVFDENACLRPSCSDDDGCPNDERCAAVWLSRHYACQQNGASCDCEAGLGLFPVNVCSPAALAGVRGRWERLVVTEQVGGDIAMRTFLPDGRVGIDQHSLETAPAMPATAQLSPEDLEQLTRDINGTDLRLELAEPEACPTTTAPCPSPGCSDYIVDLYLVDGNGNGAESPNLSKNVTGCLSSPAEVPAFVSLIELASRY